MRPKESEFLASPGPKEKYNEKVRDYRERAGDPCDAGICRDRQASHKHHYKVAQGPAGLNGGNAAGPGHAPGQDRQMVTAIPQWQSADPGIGKPLAAPGRNDKLVE